MCMRVLADPTIPIRVRSFAAFSIALLSDQPTVGPAASPRGLLGACKAAIKRAPGLERAARSYGLPLLRAARIVQARRRRGRVGRRVSV